MTPAADREEERAEMVARLQIRDEAVARAMRDVPRHRFVPARHAALAYIDEPVPLEIGDATVSAPHMVALMVEQARLRPGHRVLEVGGGMGYLAAVAAELVAPGGHVWTLEREPRLAEEAERRLRAAGFGDAVTVLAQDGSDGLPTEAPYDAILVSCAAAELREAWRSQLVDGGRLVAPIGNSWEQELLTFTREGTAGRTERGPAVRFVPLRRGPVPHI